MSTRMDSASNTTCWSVMAGIGAPQLDFNGGGLSMDGGAFRCNGSVTDMLLHCTTATQQVLLNDSAATTSSNAFGFAIDSLEELTEFLATATGNNYTSARLSDTVAPSHSPPPSLQPQQSMEQHTNWQSVSSPPRLSPLVTASTSRSTRAKTQRATGTKAQSDDDKAEEECKGAHSGANNTGRKRQNNDASIKLEAIAWARGHSIRSAAKKFNVHRSCVRNWLTRERELRHQVESKAEGARRKRLSGGGRPLLHPELDRQLAEWIREMRAKAKPLSRAILTNKAVDVFRDTSVKISNGWLEKFLNRHNIMLGASRLNRTTRQQHTGTTSRSLLLGSEGLRAVTDLERVLNGDLNPLLFR